MLIDAAGQFLICVIGMYGTFFYTSLLQERIATQPYRLPDGSSFKFKSFVFLSLLQSLAGVVVAGCALLLFNPSKKKSGKIEKGKKQGNFIKILPTLLTLGCIMSIAPQFGYASLQYISYPMQLTAKLCKMVPVLFVGVLWHRVHYPIAKYLATVVITLGVVAFFALSGNRHGSDDDVSSTEMLFGVVLVLINILFDGYMNSTQDALLAKTSWNSSQLMVGTSAVVSGFLATILAISWYFTILPEPGPADTIGLFWDSPELLKDTVTMGMMAAVGQYFIYWTVSLFGSLTVVALLLARKVGSVLLSMYVYNHAMDPLQWIALFVVFAGVVGDSYWSIKQKSKKH